MSIIQRTNFSVYKNKDWGGVAHIAVGIQPWVKGLGAVQELSLAL